MNVFDTVEGLPVHVLVVHAVVVGVPVMSLATVAVAARRSWGAPAAWAVVAINAGLLVVTWVAQQAGEALHRRRGPTIAVEHVELGGSMHWFVLALLATSVVVALAGERRPLALAALAVAVVVAAANVIWVVRVGESGSRSVWQDVVTSTNG